MLTSGLLDLSGFLNAGLIEVTSGFDLGIQGPTFFRGSAFVYLYGIIMLILIPMGLG